MDKCPALNYLDCLVLPENVGSNDPDKLGKVTDIYDNSNGRFQDCSFLLCYNQKYETIDKDELIRRLISVQIPKYFIHNHKESEESSDENSMSEWYNNGEFGLETKKSFHIYDPIKKQCQITAGNKKFYLEVKNTI